MIFAFFSRYLSEHGHLFSLYAIFCDLFYNVYNKQSYKDRSEESR